MGDTTQLALEFVCDSIPRGDGSFVVTPRKPVTREWLTPQQFAEAVDLSRSSVYRHIDSTDFPTGTIEYLGPRKIRIAKSAIQWFKEFWATRRRS